MCTTFYFYFCVPYSMLTTKNLVSICHQLMPFIYFTLPLCPFPSDDHYSVLCISVFLFCLFIYFALFMYSTYEWNHTVFVFL